MNIDLFFETRPAFQALQQVLNMAHAQEDWEAVTEISEGLQRCENCLELLEACYELEAA